MQDTSSNTAGPLSRSSTPPPTEQGEQDNEFDAELAQMIEAKNGNQSKHEKNEGTPTALLDFTKQFWMLERAQETFSQSTSIESVLLQAKYLSDCRVAIAQCANLSGDLEHLQRDRESLHDEEARLAYTWTHWQQAWVRLLSVHHRHDLTPCFRRRRMPIEAYLGDRFFTVDRRPDYLPTLGVLSIFDGPHLVGAFHMFEGLLCVDLPFYEAALTDIFIRGYGSFARRDDALRQRHQRR